MIKSSIDIKASGSEQGADIMMKIEAVSNLILKVGAALGVLLGGAFG